MTVKIAKEHHKVDPQPIKSTMANLKQLKSESSQSDPSTNFEIRVILSVVNAMMTVK